MIRAEPLLRNLSRFCAGRAKQQTCRLRTLSVTDAVNALRPFYFAVHPDFFGQYPREREVNENSLKRLNSYLECLQRPGQKALQPTQLTFYIRDTASDPNSPQHSANTSEFRAVTFTLQSKDLLSTVVKILKSCSLSTDHVQDSQVGKGLDHQNGNLPFSRPIRWDKTYYSFTGYRDPEEELDCTVRMEPALGWQRTWGVAHRCSQLHSLSRFAKQNSPVLCNVKGCTLIFGENSGMNADGQIMLGTVDVHHHWRKLLERLPFYSDLHSHLSVLKERTSYLLGDVELIYNEDLQPTLMLEDYYRMLKTFHQNVTVTQPLFHPRSLKGLQIILEKLEVEQKKLISDCTEKYGLERLYKEPSVSSEQMVRCCQRLLEGHVCELRGMHLCISHFYSVLQDGDLFVPWDWKQ